MWNGGYITALILQMISPIVKYSNIWRCIRHFMLQIFSYRKTATIWSHGPSADAPPHRSTTSCKASVLVFLTARTKRNKISLWYWHQQTGAGKCWWYNALRWNEVKPFKWHCYITRAALSGCFGFVMGGVDGRWRCEVGGVSKHFYSKVSEEECDVWRAWLEQCCVNLNIPGETLLGWSRSQHFRKTWPLTFRLLRFELAWGFK